MLLFCKNTPIVPGTAKSSGHSLRVKSPGLGDFGAQKKAPQGVNLEALRSLFVCQFSGSTRQSLGCILLPLSSLMLIR